jgi:ATP-dependent DNA helicase RecQ
VPLQFCIHLDIPKSLESYYQEAGRAGDGGEGHCLAYYSYKDVEKLENLCPVNQLLSRKWVCFIAGSGSLCRNFNVKKKILLHYFGEEFDSETGEGADMDDNVRNPKIKVEAKVR